MKQHLNYLGKRLFALAVEHSRKDTTPTKADILQDIDAIPRRKKFDREAAALGVAVARDALREARRVARIHPPAEPPPSLAERYATQRAWKDAARADAIRDYTGLIFDLVHMSKQKRREAIDVQFSENPQHWLCEKSSRNEGGILRLCVSRMWLENVLTVWEQPAGHVYDSPAFVAGVTMTSRCCEEDGRRTTVYSAVYGQLTRGKTVRCVRGIAIKRERDDWSGICFAENERSAVAKLNHHDPEVYARRQARANARKERLEKGLMLLSRFQKGGLTLESLNATEAKQLLAATEAELERLRVTITQFAGVGRRKLSV